MLSIVWSSLVVLVVVTFFGLAVLAWVPAGRSRGLLPAAPLLGAAALVVGLHLTGLVVPASIGAWILLALAIIAIIVAFIRRRGVPWRGGGEWPAVLVTGLVGLIGALVAWLPLIHAHSARVVQASANNDAFYYVAVSRWLAEHPLIQMPAIGTSPERGVDAIAFGPAYSSLDTGLRIGQEMVQASISAFSGIDATSLFSPALGVWVLIIPGGAWVLGAAFRMRPIARLVLGAVLVSSFALIVQVLNQNADSVLGNAFVPLVIGLVVLVVKRDPDGPPLWLASLVLAALAGTYTEFGPFIGLVLASIVLVRPIRQVLPALGRAAAVLGVSVAIAPAVWWRAAKSLLFVGGLAVGRDHEAVGFGDLAGSLTGPYRAILEGTEVLPGGRITVAIISLVLVFVLLGVLAALVPLPTRGLAIGALLGVALAFYIGSRGDAYIGARAVDMMTPIVLIAAVVGWSAVADGLLALKRGALSTISAAVVLVLAIGVVVTGVAASVRHIVVREAADRHVTQDYEQAAGWLRTHAGDDGAPATAAVATLFDQLWLADATVESPDVAFINLRGDLGYLSDRYLQRFWDGEGDPYVLVGPGAYFDGPDDSIIASNATFRMIRMSDAGAVVVPIPEDGNWLYTVDGAGGITAQGIADVQILARGSALSGATLEVSGPEDGTVVEIEQDGRTLASSEITDGIASLPLDEVTLAGPGARVTLSIAGDREAPFTLRGIRTQ